MNLRSHGLGISYVKAYIDACGCQKLKKTTPMEMENQVKRYVENRLVIEEYVVKDSMINDLLNQIQIKYNTLLKKSVNKMKHLIRYRCHRASTLIRKGKNIRGHQSLKQCGCIFHVDVKQRDIANQTNIIVYGQHTGHDPKSREDMFYLPVHENVLKTCMEDLWDVGCARDVAKMSFRKQDIQKAKVTQSEKICYRYFMLEKEVHNQASKLKISHILSKNDGECSMCIKVTRKGCLYSTIYSWGTTMYFNNSR